MGAEGRLLAGTEGQRALRHHLAEEYDAHYSLIASIFNGVVLFAAAAALLAIVGSGEARGPKAAALALWLASLASVMTVYNGYLVDSILVSEPPNLFDVVVPFACGLVEFAQFAVLVPLTAGNGGPASTAAQLDHLSWWFLCDAVLGAIGVPTQLNLQRHMRRTQEASPPEVAELVGWCVGQAGRGLAAAGATGCLCLAVFVLARVGTLQVGIRRWFGPLGVALFLGTVVAIALEDRVRRFMAASVAAAPADDHGHGHGDRGEPYR